MHRISSLLIALILVITNAVGQEKSDKELIRELILEFNKDLEVLWEEGSNRADQVMAYTNNRFFYEITTVNIMNIVTRSAYDRKTISYALHEMRASDVKAVRRVSNLDEIYIRDNAAIARYEVTYELYESDRLINKGIQYVNLIMRKNAEGRWLAEQLTVFNVDDKTYKSMCICEIYETQGLKSIITETIVPDGHEADILEDKFSVDESSNPNVIRHGFRDYLWDTNSKIIYVRNPDGSQGKKLGTAKSRQELLLTLLQKEVYPDRCNTVIRKLK